MVVNIQDIENVCTQFFGGTTPASLIPSTNYQLETFLQDPDCINASLMMIERGTSNHSIYFGALGLGRCYSKSTLPLTQLGVVDHKDRLLKVIFTKTLPFTVQTTLCKAYAILTKRFWFIKINNAYPMQEVVNQFAKLEQSYSENQRLTLIVLLTNIVSTMLSVDKKESYIVHSMHNRAVTNFRNNCLSPIFAYAVQLIKDFAGKIDALNSYPNSQNDMLERVVILCKECFCHESTDGTNIVDDVTESMSQTSNKVDLNKAFNVSTITALFKLSTRTPDNLACECLFVLADFSCTRSCRFERDDRQTFLKAFLDGIIDILSNHSSKLSNQQFYFNFFRLVTLTKSNNRVKEFLSLTDYDRFLELLLKYTVGGIEAMQSCSNNLLYTLNAWKPIIASQMYSRITTRTSSKLSEHALKMLRVFVTERLKYFNAVQREGAEDPLDDSSSLSQMLDVMAAIAEICIMEFSDFVIEIFDPLLGSIQDAVKNKKSNEELELLQSQLSWLIYVMAYIAQSHSEGKTVVRKPYAAHAVYRVLKTMAYLQDISSNTMFEKLEIAIITFLMRFETTFLTVIAPHLMKTYKQLDEMCGISSPEDMLRLVLGKITFNLSLWTKSFPVLNLTLSLLGDLVFNLTSAKILIAMDFTQEFLKNCSPKNFPFLGVCDDDADSIKIIRCRTKFYAAFGQLVAQTLDRTGNENDFLQILRPFSEQLDSLQNQLGNSNFSRQTQLALIGISRDLRGFCSALRSTTAYCLLFEYLYPTRLNLLATALEHFYDVPEITSPILKLFEELAMDRSARFDFPPFCANGIYLVRVCCKLICGFATRIVSVQPNAKDLYSKKLKAISSCLRLASLIISQNIVNLSVFSVYGDSAVTDAIQSSFALITSVTNPQDIVTYPKVLESYFNLLNELATVKVDFFSTLNSTSFYFVLNTIQLGLSMNDSQIVIKSSSVLAVFLMHVFNCVKKTKKDSSLNDNILSLVQQNIAAFDQILSSMLNIAVFEHTVKLNYISESFLLLILLNHEAFRKLCNQFVQTMNLEGCSVNTAELLFEEFCNSVRALMPTSQSSTFLQLLTSLRREIALLVNAQSNANSSIETTAMLA